AFLPRCRRLSGATCRHSTAGSTPAMAGLWLVVIAGVNLARAGAAAALPWNMSFLDPDCFWQVHRGTIVNVDAVSGVLRADAEKQFLLLKGRTERLPISRQFFHLFRQM